MTVETPLTAARRRDVEHRRQRVRKALDEMRQDGIDITIAAAAGRAGVHRSFIHRHPDLHAAVLQWGRRYGQRGWLRQLSGPAEPAVTDEMEDALLRTIARLDGTPFPSTARLAGRWLRGRLPARRRRDSPDGDSPDGDSPAGDSPAGSAPGDDPHGGGTLDSAYCAEVVAVTYEEMGLLPPDRRPNWYDPGRFWSGDGLTLRDGYALGGEIAVTLPPD